MKNTLAVFVGVLIAFGLNAVNVEDTKIAKEIAFEVKALEYVGAGECDIEFSCIPKEKINNSIAVWFKLTGKTKAGVWCYLYIQGGAIDTTEAGKSTTFERSFNLFKFMSSKTREPMNFSDADVPAKIFIEQCAAVKKPYKRQNLKAPNVGCLIIEKDDKGNIKSLKFEKKK